MIPDPAPTFFYLFRFYKGGSTLNVRSGPQPLLSSTKCHLSPFISTPGQKTPSVRSTLFYCIFIYRCCYNLLRFFRDMYPYHLEINNGTEVNYSTPKIFPVRFRFLMQHNHYGKYLLSFVSFMYFLIQFGDSSIP